MLRARDAITDLFRRHGLPAPEALARARPGGSRLDEMTYKDIKNAIDPSRLPHRDYAPLLKRVAFEGVRRDTLKFWVHNNLNAWDTYVRFAEWDATVADTSLNPNDAARLLVWSGNIKLHCQCPAYRFWGYAYILTQLDAAIMPEERFPHVRNPRLLNTCCKHLRRTILVLPFHVGNIAAAIREQRS